MVTRQEVCSAAARWLSVSILRKFAVPVGPIRHPWSWQQQTFEPKARVNTSSFSIMYCQLLAQGQNQPQHPPGFPPPLPPAAPPPPPPKSTRPSELPAPLPPAAAPPLAAPPFALDPPDLDPAPAPAPAPPAAAALLAPFRLRAACASPRKASETPSPFLEDVSLNPAEAPSVLASDSPVAGSTACGRGRVGVSSKPGGKQQSGIALDAGSGAKLELTLGADAVQDLPVPIRGRSCCLQAQRQRRFRPFLADPPASVGRPRSYPTL